MNNFKNNYRRNRYKSNGDRNFRKRNGNGHKINGEFKDNKLVQEVTKFISKDKKRPICSPLEN